MTDLELDVWDAWLRERQEHVGFPDPHDLPLSLHF